MIQFSETTKFEFAFALRERRSGLRVLSEGGLLETLRIHRDNPRTVWYSVETRIFREKSQVAARNFPVDGWAGDPWIASDLFRWTLWHQWHGTRPCTL